MHRGSLDVDALRRTVDELVARYDVWHSAFRRIDRRFRQVVLPAPRHPLPVHDLRGSDDPDAELGSLVYELARAPYAMKEGALVRPLLVRIADDEHRLYLAMHHLVFDGVSLYRIVLPELTALYDAEVAGRPHGLPEPLQYRDYASWQADGALDAELARHLPWWSEHLADAPTLDLPLDHPRPPEPAFRGSTHWFEVPTTTVVRLRATAAARGATLFHLLAAAYALMLRDLSGQEEVVFATVVDRRLRAEMQSMVGYCLTPAPLRIAVPASAGVLEVVDEVRREMLDVLAHNIPFGRMVAHLDPPHPVGAGPVFQAMIVLEPPGVGTHDEWSMHQLDPAVGSLLGHAKNDLHLELDERTDGHLSARLIVNRDILDERTALRCVALFEEQLARLARS